MRRNWGQTYSVFMAKELPMAIDLYTDNYPESWYALMPARALEPGEIRPMDILGKKLLLFRTAQGQPKLYSRFCPHMGASLENGFLKEEHIVCPFHNWEYDASGKCVCIPYMPGGKIPPRAELEVYPVVEHLQWLWVYNGIHPAFELPDMSEAHDPEYGLRQKSQLFEIHPLLILENGCDIWHFKYVHKVDFVRYEAEMIRQEPHEFSYVAKQYLRKPIAGRDLVKTSIDYIGATIIYGTLEYGDYKVARFIAAPLPLANKRTLFHLIVYPRKLKGVRSLINPYFMTYFANRLFHGATDDYYPIWKPMNTGYRRYLISEDRLQQQFRTYYKAHLIEGNIEAVN
jgi:phenylpropionate dioxygenase-like ring-hydroxylating dioxygenase large terminal subunit